MRIWFYKYLTLFLTGGMIYYYMEIFIRGYSHYSMIICGGLAMICCGGLNQIFPGMSILSQMVLSAVIITILEFVTGYIVNIIFDIGVWSYSYLPYNFMGQVCLLYSILWCFMSLLIIFVDDGIRHYLYGESLPVYKWL